MSVLWWCNIDYSGHLHNLFPAAWAELYRPMLSLSFLDICGSAILNTVGTDTTMSLSLDRLVWATKMVKLGAYGLVTQKPAKTGSKKARQNREQKKRVKNRLDLMLFYDKNI